MALFYQLQGYLQKLKNKTGVSSDRLSEQRQILFGGRGETYDELVYLRGQNTDAAGVNRHESDAWVKFAPANGSGSTSNRYDQQFHDFTVNGSFP